MKDPISERPQIVLVTRACIIDHQKNILILKRSPEDSYGGGEEKWEFPGGKVDKGEVISEALEREIYEECGLNIKIENPTSYVYNRLSEMEKYQGFLMLLVIKPIIEFTGKIKLSKDHTEYAWVKVKDINKYPISKDTKQFLLDYNL